MKEIEILKELIIMVKKKNYCREEIGSRNIGFDDVSEDPCQRSNDIKAFIADLLGNSVNVEGLEEVLDLLDILEDEIDRNVYEDWE